VVGNGTGFEVSSERFDQRTACERTHTAGRLHIVVETISFRRQ
jgi:hypothetical protein